MSSYLVSRSSYCRFLSSYFPLLNIFNGVFPLQGINSKLIAWILGTDTATSIFKQLDVRHIISDRLTKTASPPTMALGSSTCSSLQARGICCCSVLCSKLAKQQTRVPPHYAVCSTHPPHGTGSTWPQIYSSLSTTTASYFYHILISPKGANV